MSNSAHDIIMEARDLMGREVKLFTQADASAFGGVGIFWGTISGVSEKGSTAHVTVDGFRAGYDSAERADHMLVEARKIIHISPV